MKKQNRKTAFSLVELAIATLIISFLLVGVFAGKELVSQANLKGAQGLTKSSPVASIPDLALWLETSLSDSITNSSGSDAVASWNDISGNNIDVTQDTDDNRPIYIEKGIGNLPSISFDGSNDFLLNATSVPLPAGADSFAFVAVWYRPSGLSGAKVVFEQNTNAATTTGNRASMLILNGSTYGFNGQNNDFHNTATYVVGKPVISVINLTAPTGGGTTIAVNVYTNSNTSVNGTINAATQNVSNGAFIVGAKGITTKAEFMAGYISEIMVFSRNLNPNEISIINNYLSQKYNITLS